MTTTSTFVQDFLETRPTDLKGYSALEKAEQVEFCKWMKQIVTNKNFHLVMSSLIERYKESLIYNQLEKGEFGPQDFRSRILALRDLNSLMLSFAANVKKD
jgi:hypothetical protein